MLSKSDKLHEDRPILVRDLSICGQGVYLRVPRRQFECFHCKKISTERLSFVEMGRNFTIRYEEYIYERVKELTVEQVSKNEDLEKKDLEELLNFSPCLSIAYELKEELRNIYESSTTVKMGLRRIQKWLVLARCLFGQTAKTVEKHTQEICHYFVNRTTSGVMEGINNKIKLIIRQSYGFNTFDSLREKLLACLF